MSDPSSNTASDLRCLVAEAIKECRPDPESPFPRTAQVAVHVARALQRRATELQTPHEERQQAELDRMLQDPNDKATLVQLTDQSFRSEAAWRTVDQMTHILDVQGIPRFFSPLDRTLLKGFQAFGGYLPGVAVPLIKEKMQHETANVILPAEPELLAEHLQARRDEGVRMNVNYLGEALLGEREARQRLDRYLEALASPDVEVLSVKISTLHSQLWPLARTKSVATLCDRLEQLYQAASRATFRHADGTEVPKFVYLDMEEYRDMSVTAEAFMRTLDRPGLEQVAAGIALQAYLPDSFRTQKEINTWARDRIATGGAPVTIRVVKGANMEMERVEASLEDWPQAPFRSKQETDANYKRMVQEGMRPENLRAVCLGIATHNLFDMAYGLVLASQSEHVEHVQFEMLEGMANAQRRALRERTRQVLLYAPACKQKDFLHAIGYLIRRLDENTGPENFLRHAFHLQVDDDVWKQLEQSFLNSFQAIDPLADMPQRRQDRTNERKTPANGSRSTPFNNEPDTDFSLPQNVRWAESIVERWVERKDHSAEEIPVVLDGTPITDGRATVDCFDPSRPGTVVGRYRRATREEIDVAVACARTDLDGWRSMRPKARHEILGNVAEELRAARGDLIGAALADGGKTIAESDPEVSEAIDFVEYYRDSALEWHEYKGPSASGRGVVVVVAPWNFPIAIPCGGIAAALAAGNTVILKPASESVLPAWLLCQAFWRGGVSQRTLQFAPCSGATVGESLVTHRDVDTVLLTGGTETAWTMLRAKPDMRLLAETGGKNVTIVTALADREQAIQHVVQSAFGHSGQKCSATSLLILEEEVYNDPRFRRTLCDAVESLEVGSAWELKNRVGPLIRVPTGVLQRGIEMLEPGESWAVAPRTDPINPQLVTPAVKWDVTPGNFTHTTELFGPVLGVMKAKDLAHAIDLVNATGYGLTSGLESLDDREQALWQKSIRAGNLYINRTTTGAIVLRQPFGGVGKSAIGPGSKAGGPNYVAQLMTFATKEETPKKDQDDIARVQEACVNYDQEMRTRYATEHDPVRLIGQDNLHRYLPAGNVRIRIHPDDSDFDLFARIAAAQVAGCRITVSRPSEATAQAISTLADLANRWAALQRNGEIEWIEESDEQLAAAMRAGHIDRIRYAHPTRVPRTVQEAVVESGVHIAERPVSLKGRLELLAYLVEQTASIDYHRYGNLGRRAAESRTASR